MMKNIKGARDVVHGQLLEVTKLVATSVYVFKHLSFEQCQVFIKFCISKD